MEDVRRPAGGRHLRHFQFEANGSTFTESDQLCAVGGACAPAGGLALGFLQARPVIALDG